MQVENSGRRGRRSDDASGGPVDANVFDQWEAANTGGLGGAGSITRQKVRHDTPEGKARVTRRAHQRIDKEAPIFCCCFSLVTHGIFDVT